MRNRTVACTAVVLATALALPAWGRPSGQPEPDESGCRNLLSGFAAYQRLVESISQEEYAPRSGEALGMYKSRVVTVRDKGVATAGLVLEAPSCTDVEYTVEVYDPESFALLATHSQKGDSVSGTSDAPLMLEAVVANHASSTVLLRVFTKSKGVVHDVGPDAQDPAAKATAPADGLPGGGATSSFR